MTDKAKRHNAGKGIAPAKGGGGSKSELDALHDASGNGRERFDHMDDSDDEEEEEEDDEELEGTAAGGVTGLWGTPKP